MEDWLQEFDPLVQGAVQKAFRRIEERGGDALSIEDLLLVFWNPIIPWRPSFRVGALISTSSCAPSSVNSRLSQSLPNRMACPRT